MHTHIGICVHSIHSVSLENPYISQRRIESYRSAFIGYKKTPCFVLKTNKKLSENSGSEKDLCLTKDSLSILDHRPQDPFKLEYVLPWQGL